MFEGKKRYGEMLASNEKIATNVLADRLERLEHFGIVEIRQGRIDAPSTPMDSPTKASTLFRCSLKSSGGAPVTTLERRRQRP